MRSASHPAPDGRRGRLPPSLLAMPGLEGGEDDDDDDVGGALRTLILILADMLEAALRRDDAVAASKVKSTGEAAIDRGS